MRYTKLGDSYLLRLDKDEEIVAAINTFAADRWIDVGEISGIGSARDLSLGYYDIKTKEYITRHVADDVEIVSLMGNISMKEGRAFAHLHITISGRDFQATAGHLFSGIVTGTCEVIVRPLTGYVQRVKNEEIGLFLLDI